MCILGKWSTAVFGWVVHVKCHSHECQHPRFPGRTPICYVMINVIYISGFNIMADLYVHLLKSQEITLLKRAFGISWSPRIRTNQIPFQKSVSLLMCLTGHCVFTN